MLAAGIELVEALTAGAVVGAIAIAMLALAGSKRRPKERTFRCGRCAAVTPHSARTIEAWSAGKTKFFCSSCHGLWLKSQPTPARPHTPVNTGRGSGCLGMLLLLVVIPLVAAGIWMAGPRRDDRGSTLRRCLTSDATRQQFENPSSYARCRPSS